MTGAEIDFVVTDSIKALALYESIFEVERIEVSDNARGLNEAVFTIYGTRFHILDENPAYMLIAPKPGDPKPMWLNILVPDIRATWQKAMDAGCTVVQPLTEMEPLGIINAIFADEFGYLWMLHEITRVVSYEERIRAMEEMMNEGK